MFFHTIHNREFKGDVTQEDSQPQFLAQQCSDSYNIVPTLQRCVALKIVLANRPL